MNGMPKPGEKEFQRAMELNPNDSSTLRYYGSSMLHQGRFEEAEAAVRQALEIDPLSPIMNTVLGAFADIWQAVRGRSGTIAQNVGNGSEFP